MKTALYYQKVLGAIIAGVPDLKVTAEDVFVSADGSRVVGRYRYEGTHTGNLLGYAGTGNSSLRPFLDMLRERYPDLSDAQVPG